MVKIQSDFYKTWKGSLIEKTLTGDDTLDSTEEIISVTTTSVAIDVTLPDTTSVGDDTKKIWVYDNASNAATNNITVKANTSDSTTIDGLSEYVIGINDGIAIFELIGGNWTVINRGSDLKRVNVSTTFTAGVNDDVIFGDTSGGAFTITLAPIADVQQRTLIIKKVTGAANQLILTGDGTETIEGNLTLILTGSGGPSVTLFPENTTNWAIL